MQPETNGTAVMLKLLRFSSGIVTLLQNDFNQIYGNSQFGMSQLLPRSLVRCPLDLVSGLQLK